MLIIQYPPVNRVHNPEWAYFMFYTWLLLAKQYQQEALAIKKHEKSCFSKKDYEQAAEVLTQQAFGRLKLVANPLRN